VRFIAHASSSVGNLYEVVAGNGQRLLIECGVTWAKLQKALKYDLTNIAGCLLSHEHKDHSKAVEDVMAAGIDVWASEGTFKAIEDSLPLHRRANVVRGKERFFLAKTFEVFPFVLKNKDGEMCHDAAEPMGFKIKDKTDGEEMLFVTDTRSIPAAFGVEFSLVAICCGYDVAVLRQREAAGTIDPSLAKRLLTSHMEQETTKLYLRKACCLGKCTEIWLLHCSRDNLDAEKVRSEIELEFFVKTVIAGKEVKNGRN